MRRGTTRRRRRPLMRLAMTGKYLIVNADDFGASSGVNRGIVEAHRLGIVTSTSLLVDAAGSAEAATLARSAPTLSVGLHVALEPRDGTSGWTAGLGEELSRQADRFVELMGCSPSHVDSHRNVHRAPGLLPGFVDLARRWGVPLRGHSPIHVLPSFYGQWAGESHPEHIGVAGMARILESKVGVGITELICHPGYCDPQLCSSYAREREVELATLCDPSIRHTLADFGIELVNHQDLGRLVVGTP